MMRGQMELGEHATVEERLALCEDALRECTRLSGEDLSDGFPDWPPLHEYAVRCVKELRESYDAAIAQIPY